MVRRFLLLSLPYGKWCYCVVKLHCSDVCCASEIKGKLNFTFCEAKKHHYNTIITSLCTYRAKHHQHRGLHYNFQCKILELRYCLFIASRRTTKQIFAKQYNQRASVPKFCILHSAFCIKGGTLPLLPPQVSCELQQHHQQSYTLLVCFLWV